MNRKFLVLLIFVSVISLPAVAFGTPAVTVAPLSPEQVQLLNRLYAEVAVLQARLNELQAQAASLPMPRLTKQLTKGINDEEVKVLQAVLATDPEIYPEGYTTGYFGSLTEKAMKKFQKKAGLTETGRADGQTIWRINELLAEGAGRSGKIPPGLLRAPGIMKKLGLATTTPPGPDTIAPVIISPSATSTTSSSTAVVWQTNELTIGAVRYATSTPIDGAFSPLTASDPVWQTNHQLTLGNLPATTTYYYYIAATDYAGNRATSTPASFTTLGQ